MTVEKITIDEDIHVIAVAAPFFPDGIGQAFDALHAVLEESPQRRIFGLSRPEQDGEIVYRAAAEALGEDEAEKVDFESITIKKGTYVSVTVPNFKQNVAAVGEAFQELMEVTNLDPEGYCVEWYDANLKGYGTAEESVRCMIRLDD